jgi:hypothetical protein
MYRRKIIVAAFFLILSNWILGQTTQTQKLLPSILPPSPEAAAIARFGNYDVNEFTGVPNISIPLYTIKVGELTVPVSLNYHASGNKVTDIPTRAGLGWSLEAGGTITRKIVGNADEVAGFNGGCYFNATSSSPWRVKDPSQVNENTDSSLTYLWSITQGRYDVEPDIFSYSFPGHSGKFLFDQRNNFQPYVIPYAPIAVTKTQTSATTISMAIMDESGINYQFNTIEASSTGGGAKVINATSAWMLDHMTSSNGQDDIHFLYSQNPAYGNTDSYISDFVTFNDNITGNSPAYTYGSPTYGSDQGYVITTWQQLNEIDFKNGKIVFEAAPETRYDFNAGYKLQNRIKDIQVYSYDAVANSYTLLRTINFFHSYFMNGTDNTTARLRLDSLQIVASGHVAETYKFDYNTTISLPVNTSRMKDYWGYFNNITNLNPYAQPTLIPKMQVPYNQPPNPTTTIWIGGDHTNARDPDPNYMQAEILQKITFPTGGNTQFTYETNQYLDDQNAAHYAGGLRVKTIKSYESAGATPLVKTYTYGAGESGYGRANFFLESYYFANHQYVINTPALEDGAGQCYTQDYKSLNTYFSNPTNDIEGYDCAPVVYSTVTEYTGDNVTNNGKIIYQFSDKADARTDAIEYGKAYFDSYHFIRGLPVNKSIYKWNGNNYVLLSEERKGYQFFPFQWSTGGIGLIVSKQRNNENSTTPDQDVGTEQFINGCTTLPSDVGNYNYNYYDLVSGDNKLVADTSIVYDQSDPTKYMSTITSYTYDDLTHLGLSQTQTTNSKLETLQSKYTYPYNYTTSPYNLMDAAHIWDKQVNETKLNGSTQLTSQTTNYGTFTGTNYLPQNISLQIAGNTAETRASFNSYDIRGNILEMQKANDVKQSFIWDYQMLQPVAQVTNAAQADIAYCSFEADGKGNWVFSGAPVADASSPTGNNCYLLTNGSITRSGLTAGISYIVSFWKKSTATVTVAGGTSTSIQGKTINNWTYYEYTITGATSVTISGSAYIDELRLYPSTSHMTTYTYATLLGVSSTCDVNNRITYYFYDLLGRLTWIKDQDGNILKTMQYHYQGIPGLQY